METVTFTGKTGTKYLYYAHPLPVSFNPDQAGNYIFCRKVGTLYFPIYIGEGDLGARITPAHHQWDQIHKKGATHVCEHLHSSDRSRKDEEADVLAGYPNAFEPSGCNVKHEPLGQNARRMGSARRTVQPPTQARRLGAFPPQDYLGVNRLIGDLATLLAPPSTPTRNPLAEALLSLGTTTSAVTPDYDSNAELGNALTALSNRRTAPTYDNSHDAFVRALSELGKTGLGFGNDLVRRSPGIGFGNKK